MSSNTTDIELKIGLSDSDKASMQAAVVALIKASLITPYSTSATYAVGDFVYYSGDGKIYKCTTAISTAEAWTSGHWTEATLNDIIDAVNAAVASVNNKVEPDDICPELRAGYAFTADNLIATKGLTVNDDPMSFGIVGGAQKSAVGDGNASLNKLVCVDVVKNNITQYPVYDFTFTIQSNGYYNFNIANATYMIAGHMYLIYNRSKWDDANISSINCFYGTGSFKASSTQSGSFVANIVTLSSDFDSGLKFFRVNGTPGATVSFHFDGGIIDLTKWFGSNEVVNAIIGATGTDMEKVARLVASDPNILNVTEQIDGTLVPSKTAKLLPVGVNQWDEIWELGAINLTTGQNQSSSTYFRSKNYIEVLGGKTYYSKSPSSIYLALYDASKNFIMAASNMNTPFAVPSRCRYIRFYAAGTTYNHDICINVSDSNINGKYYPSKRNHVTLPNYEGHGILKVVDGKVVADGTELYPDGNSKKRYGIVDLSQIPSDIYYVSGSNCWEANLAGAGLPIAKANGNAGIPNVRWTNGSNVTYWYDPSKGDNGKITVRPSGGQLELGNGSSTTMPTGIVVYELATEEDITTSVYQANFPVEQGGTLQFLDENNNPIAGLQGSEIFYQKNIKAFVEAFGEAIDWDPARIERLANLSFTPEYVNITLDPSPTGAYARAQVYNATFTIVISAALTGTPSGSITFQDSEVDLSGFETKPAEAIYDMDGKKVSEAPTTADCNIASFVGRSKSGIILWSLLHSGVNKVKIHIEEAVPLDSSGNGKIDCRASLIL